MNIAGNSPWEGVPDMLVEIEAEAVVSGPPPGASPDRLRA
jgi:hypothetical protein